MVNEKFNKERFLGSVVNHFMTEEMVNEIMGFSGPSTDTEELSFDNSDELLAAFEDLLAGSKQAQKIFDFFYRTPKMHEPDVFEEIFRTVPLYEENIKKMVPLWDESIMRTLQNLSDAEDVKYWLPYARVRSQARLRIIDTYCKLVLQGKTEPSELKDAQSDIKALYLEVLDYPADSSEEEIRLLLGYLAKFYESEAVSVGA